MTRAVLGSLLLAMAIAAQAEGAAPPEFKEGAERFGQPGRIVAFEFSADDGKPHIAVVRLASPRFETPSSKYTPVRRIAPRYPDRAIRESVEGSVYARLDVDGEGKVRVSSARAYSRKESGVLRTFEAEARRAFESWHYPPPDDGKPWAGCYTVNFSLRD